MKANELRIGNWAMYSSKIQVNENKIRECVDHPDRFAPIPLTEEWLIKFGFEIDKSTDAQWFFKENDIDVSFGLAFNYMGNNAWELYTGSQPIEHVHQLQNLYHALTGEDLSINEG